MIMELLTAYWQGLVWFGSLCKAFVWDNPWWLWENSHWSLFLFYILYLRVILVGFWGMTWYFWDQGICETFKLPRGFGAVIEWLIIASVFSFFYTYTWIPHQQYWGVLQKIVTAIYSDGLKWAWDLNWIFGICYFGIVNLVFGVMIPINLTGLFHGEYPLLGIDFSHDRKALNDHNTFMQLVNIEKAVGRISRR